MKVHIFKSLEKKIAVEGTVWVSWLVRLSSIAETKLMRQDDKKKRCRWEVLFIYYTPSPFWIYIWVGWGWGILESLCPSVVLSLCPMCLLTVSWTTQPFFTKLGVVVYYHKAMCHAEKLVHYLQYQGHSEGLYIQIWLCFFTISSRLPVCLQPNLV